MSQGTISLLERGYAAGMSLRTIRGMVEALDARLRVDVLWRAGELDRLLDERHAQLVVALAALLTRADWEIHPEVTYSHYGERGSIDLLGWHAPTRLLLSCEVKTKVMSVEEMLRRHDQKVRLAPRVATERFGWRSSGVGRLLVVADERTNRRRVERLGSVLVPAYPARGWAVRTWLRQPAGPLSGLLFLPYTSEARGRRGSDGSRRS